METSTKDKLNILSDNTSQTSVKGNRFFPRYNLILMTLTLAVADLGGLLLAGIGAVAIRFLIGGGFAPGRYIDFIPLIFLFLIPYSISGLYPGVGNTFVDELGSSG